MQPTTTPKPGLMNENNSSIKDSYLQSIIRRNQQITDHYHLDRDCFARGKFAQVRRIQHKQTGTLYAAKTIRKRRPRCGNVTEEIMHEIRVLITANRCPRIVGLFEVFETASEYILVLELAEGGELQQILDVDDYISEENCRKLMRQIIEGIRYLHSHQIAHLDIKPQNILLTSPLPEGDVKLCDFGISRLISDKWEIREIMGTTDYMPPEVLQYEPITIASDMWSIGIVTYVLLSGHSPFGGDDKVHTYSNITSGSLDFPDKLFGSVSDLAKDFIQKLLIQNPKHRLTCDECLEHEWLKTTKSIPSQPLLEESSLTITPMNELINGIETDSNSNCDEEELHHSIDNTNSNDNSPVSNVVDLNGNFINHNANGGGNSGGDTNGTETQASALTPESTNPDSCDIANNDNNKLKSNTNGQSCQTLANNNSNIISVSDGQNSDHMSESDSEEYMSLANSDHESDKENQLEVQLVEMNTDNTADKLVSKFSVPNVVAKSSSSAILSPKTNNHNNNIPMPYSKLQQKRHSSDIFPESPKLLAIINHSSSNGSSADLLRKSSITGSGILSQTASNNTNNGGCGAQTVENGTNNSELLPSSLSASTSTPVTIKIENETNNSSTSSASSSPPITPNKKIYLSVDDSGSNTSTPTTTTTISKHNFHNRSSSSSHHTFNFATAENRQQQQHCRSVSMERLDSQTASERHCQQSIDASLGYWSDRVINGGQLASTKQLVDDHRNDNNGKQQCDSMLSFCHPNASIVANQNKTLSSNSSSSFFSSTCSATSSSMSSSSSNSVEISLNSDSWNIFRMSVNNFSQSSENNNNGLIGAESESNDSHEINHHHHHHFNSLPIQLSTELNNKSTVTADTQSSMIS